MATQGWFSCRASRQPAPTQPTCRRPHCSELVQPGCPVGYCILSPRCPLHDPLSLSGNGQGGCSLLNDGSATPTSLVQPLGFAQFNCRRLWGSHDAVHDGFMGLVSCLDQLHVRVVCVQETQAPSLGTLPVDQSFRYDAPLGSYGKQGSCSTLLSTLLASQVLKTRNLCVGGWLQVQSASVPSMLPMWALLLMFALHSGAFWLPLCSMSHRCTPIAPCFLLATPTFGF